MLCQMYAAPRKRSKESRSRIYGTDGEPIYLIFSLHYARVNKSQQGMSAAMFIVVHAAAGKIYTHLISARIFSRLLVRRSVSRDRDAKCSS